MGLILVSSMTLAAGVGQAGELPRERLWPQGAPEAKGTDPHQDQPAITIYTPTEDLRTETAVVICPGGGYGGLAMGHEGTDIADWLTSLGITGVLLEYRMQQGGYMHPVPMLDVQRAIRTVRSRAGELQLNPAQIGVMGFSAGGHLASTAGTHFDAGAPEATDPVDRVSSRPDFMILCYPVIAFGEPFTHQGSQHNLIGRDAPGELVTRLSNEKQVTPDTPPTFLFHTDEDRAVPSENSVVFYRALRKVRVPAELHIYRQGGHGVGLARKLPGTGDWPGACERWLQGQGLLPIRPK